MRLVELDLARYGPFTGRRLAFRPEAKLHVVYGANEAGKSASLAAITDLLYGIPRDSAQAFLHNNRELELTARIVDRTGRAFAFTRRKNKPQLCDADGREIGAEALAPYLGGVGRALFQRAFGLDAAQLRRSGEDLGDSQGELGAALFSASAGLRGLEALKAQLGREAEVLFLPNGRKRRYNDAVNRLKEARRAEHDGEITASALRQLERDAAEAEARLLAIAEERRGVEAERARLDLLRRVRPLMAARRRLIAARADLGALPAAEAGLGAKLGTALEKAATAAAAAETARRRLAAATDEAEAIRPETALLDRDAAIGLLVQDWAALRKAERALPGLAAEAERLAAELDDCARRLGLADAQAVVAGRLDDGCLARLTGRLAAGRRHEDAAASAAETWRRQEAERARHAADLAEAVADPAPLREAFAALKPALDGLAAAARERADIAAETAALIEEARRLDPSVADLDRLADSALPGRAAIDAAAATAAEHLARCRDAEREVARAASEHDAAAARLAALGPAGDLPTPERIAEARAARQALWRTVRAGDVAAIVAYEAAVAAADRLADAALAEADRIGTLARARADRDAAAADLALATEALETARAARAADRDAWGTRWAALGIRRAAPEAMRAWRADLDALFARRAALAKRAAAAAAAEAAGAAARPVLDSLAAALGLAPLPQLPADLAGERVARALAERERAHGAALERRGVVAGLARAAAEAAAAEAEASAALADWRREAAADLARLGLDATADLDEAAARLAVWRGVPERLAALDDRRRRQAEAAREAETVAATLATLVAEAAPDLVDLSRDAAVAALEARLAAAREARTRREAAERRRMEAAAEAQAADAEAGQAGAAAARLAARLAEPATIDRQDPAPPQERDDAAALAALAGRLAERDRLAAELAALEEQIGHIVDGAAPDALDAALARLDETAQAAAIAAAEARRAALEAEASAASLNLERARRVLAEGGDNRAAERAAQERRMAEAELVETAESWLALSLAAALLGRAIEAKRGADHGPMLARAGDLFRLITGGAFAGLGQAYDDDDRPLILARRASGVEIGLKALSEGTRDQLFLALRLAYLESFARDAEPPPFVGDDLFASFDDGRTATGLQALAEIGGAVQPILFTHHRRVADMATAGLGPAADVIEL